MLQLVLLMLQQQQQLCFLLLPLLKLWVSHHVHSATEVSNLHGQHWWCHVSMPTTSGVHLPISLLPPNACTRIASKRCMLSFGATPASKCQKQMQIQMQLRMLHLMLWILLLIFEQTSCICMMKKHNIIIILWKHWTQAARLQISKVPFFKLVLVNPKPVFCSSKILFEVCLWLTNLKFGFDFILLQSLVEDKQPTS